jgi:hypothetical protein
MQLKRKQRRKLRQTLLASSCALLGTAGTARAADGDWSFDAGVLYYSEVDRVRAIEPAVIVKRDLGDDASVSARVVSDTLSGATPTGAMPASTGTTVTSPSGQSGNAAGAGKTPLDNSFRDQRYALSVTWSRPLSQLWRLDLGANYSTEHDFQSQGINLLLARDFNERNTTVSAGVSFESDLIKPIGGIHQPLSTIKLPPPPEPEDPEPDMAAMFPQGVMPAADEGGGDGNGEAANGNPAIASSDHKHVKDLLLGVTQVMNRDWIVALNYSYSRSDGYQNDPYKVVSIINSHLGGFFPGGPGGGFGPALGDPLSNIYESRPSTRVKHALYLQNKAYLGGQVLDFSYRYGWDDWGIKSSTYELRYRIPFGESWYAMPHLRWYHQSQADFYHRGLLDTDVVPQYVSADYRLAEFSARTVGIEFGTATSWGGRASVRLEHYVQSGGSDPHVNIGVQQAYDLFPELKADIVQFSVSF